MRAILLLAITGFVFGQDQPAIEIHGVVTEIGLNAGLAGAEVNLFEFAGPQREKTLFATAATGAHGEFDFHPLRFGNYWVEVKKQAYFASVSIDGPQSRTPPAAETGTLVTVSAAHPSQEVRLALMRPGELSGIVLDESDKPLPHVVVDISMDGLPALSQVTARTGDDGVFTAKMLMPGDYIVKVSSLLPRAMLKFSEEDTHAVDEDLEPVYWPGVFDQASAAPVRVAPGASASLGTIHLRKTPSYRVRVSMEGCLAGGITSLAIRAPGDGFPMPVLQDAPAGQPPPILRVGSCQDVLVRGLKPGSYTFVLSGPEGYASAPVEITKQNRDVALFFSSGFDVSGRFATADDGSLPPLDKVKIQLLSEDAMTGAQLASPPDEKGAFTMRGGHALGYRVSVLGLDNQHYVKELRVDGQPAPDGIVRLSQGSRLEIVLDGQPASIAGTVTDGDKPFSQPLIFVVKWPSLEAVTLDPITGDNGGQFQIAGLAPGEYRVLAVPSTPLPDGQQIGQRMLGELWSSADSVTLEQGGSKTIALKLSDPLR